jgi:hypothetical protein
MWACVELLRSNTTITADAIHFVRPGDRVRVYVYYRFSAVSTLLPTSGFPAIVAESEFSFE